MGILGNEAAYVVAKKAAEEAGTTRSGCRGGIRQWAKQRKRDYVEGGKERSETVINRAMEWKRKAVTNYCRLRGFFFFFF